MVNRKLPAVWFGGDYNPDQWDEQVWKQDIEEMKRQHVNVVTLPVFSWAHLQPAEDRFDFEWLDRILDLLYENGIHVIMAISNCCSACLDVEKYPEILPDGYSGKKKTAWCTQ
ncbi:MAG: beta-galactosidase [Oscillospiraceae bacterium]